MFEVDRSETGVWAFVGNDGIQHPDFGEALPRYLTSFDRIFTAAKKTSEWDFLLSLFRVRGIEPTDWDPFVTTRKAVPAILELHERAKSDFDSARHLQLWVYGVIVEASEPYELLANLLGIANGESYLLQRFPPDPRGHYPSPGTKIRELESAAVRCGLDGAVEALNEVWDRVLRNGIFHSDYAISRSDVVIRGTNRQYSHSDILRLVNRALAYFIAITTLFDHAIASYDAPKVIDVPPSFSHGQNQRAVVIVRKRHGAVALKDNWSPDELRRGQIPFLLGRLYSDEHRLLEQDRSVALLPERPTPK